MVRMERIAARSVEGVVWTLPPGEGGERFAKTALLVAGLTVLGSLALLSPLGGWKPLGPVLTWFVVSPSGTVASLYLQRSRRVRADGWGLAIGRSPLTERRLRWPRVRRAEREGDALRLGLGRRTLWLPLPPETEDRARLLALAGVAP